MVVNACEHSLDYQIDPFALTVKQFIAPGR